MSRQLHWGHARSRDLVNWEHLPIALVPSNELGELHCFSGCTTLNNGVPTIVYTSIGEGERNAHNGAEQSLAYSDDNMLTWKKEPVPALTNAIHTQSWLGEAILEWCDPFIWRENNEWHLVLEAASGARLHNTLSFRQPDRLLSESERFSVSGHLGEAPCLYRFPQLNAIDENLSNGLQRP
ncbi:MAG: glycoside hydrolase family 32 protein [Treponema sp.]|nr:glycoside hydrolase family 32 protein [Treponema sp.]